MSPLVRPPLKKSSQIHNISFQSLNWWFLANRNRKNFFGSFRVGQSAVSLNSIWRSTLKTNSGKVDMKDTTHFRFLTVNLVVSIAFNCSLVFCSKRFKDLFCWALSILLRNSLRTRISDPITKSSASITLIICLWNEMGGLVGEPKRNLARFFCKLTWDPRQPSLQPIPSSHPVRIQRSNPWRWGCH